MHDVLKLAARLRDRAAEYHGGVRYARRWNFAFSAKCYNRHMKSYNAAADAVWDSYYAGTYDLAAARSAAAAAIRKVRKESR